MLHIVFPLPELHTIHQWFCGIYEWQKRHWTNMGWFALYDLTALLICFCWSLCSLRMNFCGWLDLELRRFKLRWSCIHLGHFTSELEQQISNGALNSQSSRNEINASAVEWNKISKLPVLSVNFVIIWKPFEGHFLF